MTGASRGLGLALTQRLAEDFPSLQVLAVARTAPQLSLPNLHFLAADLATEVGRTAVSAFLGSQPVRYLVHNAGLIGPAGFSNTSFSAYQATLALNLEAPFFLTQILTANLVPSARILLIGSKAGEVYMLGVASYCISKAGLFMLRQVLNEELKGVDTAIVMPGIAETEMFREWYDLMQEKHTLDLGKVLKTEIVARFLVYLLRDTPAEAYRTTIWDIYEPNHHHLWLPQGSPAPQLPFISSEKL